MIEKLRELKQSMMHELFTRGTRGEKMRMTEIGEVPESWKIIKIDDLFKFSSGKSRPQDITPKQDKGHIFPVYGGNGIM